MEGGLIESLLAALSQHWVLITFTLFLGWLVKNRYNNGLNKYPGPFLASLTDWWRFIDVYGQRPERTLRALHDKHGDIVRTGPNTLSFSDPAALKSIYGLNKGFVKVSTYLPLGLPISNHTTVRLLHRPAIRRKGLSISVSLQHHRQ